MEYGLVILWWLTCLALAGLGLPIASQFFRRLPGRGTGFALPVALSIVTIVTFWIGHVTFGWLAIGGGIAALVILAVLSFRAGFDFDRRAVLESLLVFTVGFSFMVAVRAVDPALLPYTEDFLDFGMMQALLRADRLPPEDFWYAGSAVRYYYGGHLIAAILTRLTGTAPWYAENLALAGFYAMLITGVYELASAIAVSQGRSRMAAGAGAVFFVGFAGNLLVPIVGVLHLFPDRFADPVSRQIAEQIGRTSGELVVHGLSEFQYGDVGQVIPHAITVFPLFSWLHGELHANMTNLPFLVLVTAICYTYFCTPEKEVRYRRLLVFLAAPLAAGLVAFIDTWSFPTSLGILWLTLVFSPANPSSLLPDAVATSLASHTSTRLGEESARMGGSLALVIAATTLGVLVVSPFLLVTARGGTETIGIVPAANRTSFVELFLVYGAFLLLFTVSLLGHLRTPVADRVHRRETAATVAALGLVIPVAWFANVAALVLFLPLLVSGWYLLRSDHETGYDTVLLVGGAGLVLLTEVVYLSNPEYIIPGRGNTVFRVYLQAWVIWGIAAGVVLPPLLPEVDVRRSVSSLLSRGNALRAAFVALLLLSTASYGALSTYNHFDRAFERPEEPWEQAAYVYEARQMQGGPDAPTNPPTLDGLLYASVEHPNETDAIRWIANEISGTPTMVSAPGGRWEWRSPASGLTGVPTVAGWGHELIYRDWEAYYRRVDEVRTIYRGSPTRRVELLRKYDVQYVYVGPDERERYDIWSFFALEGVSVAYENEGVTIYRVNQSRLAMPSLPRLPWRFESDEFTANESVATAENDSIVSRGGSNGTLIWYGPYITLYPGTYTATFEINVTKTDGSGQPVATVDVVRGAVVRSADYRILASRSVSGTDGVRKVTMTFTLDHVATDLEFRGQFADSAGTVRLHSVTIRNATAGRFASGPDDVGWATQTRRDRYRPLMTS